MIAGASMIYLPGRIGSAEPESAPAASAIAPVERLGPPRLLLFQQQLPTAEYVAAHIDEVDALPFEGVIFSIPSTDLMRTPQVISVEQFRTELAPMVKAQAQLRKVRHNFVYVRLIRVNPFVVETSTVAQSMANLATAAREAGLTGIVYDNEDYEDDTWAPAFSCPGSTLEACSAEAKQAGATIMRAMLEQWPDMTLMTTLGPFFGDPVTFRAILNEEPKPKHHILGAFAAGLGEATIGTDATYVDGGEVYFVHNDTMAMNHRRLRKVDLPRDSPLVTDALRQQFASKVSLAFTFYDENGGDPARWRNDIGVALRATDQYVWAFAFHTVWLGTPGPGKSAASRDWIDATVAGRVEGRTTPMPL